MPVTVIAAIPPAPSKAVVNAPATGANQAATQPTKSPGEGADANNASQDFASLLLDQMVPAVAPGITITDAAATGQQETAGELPTDESALFATLGLIDPQSTRGQLTAPDPALASVAGSGAAGANGQGKGLNADMLGEAKLAVGAGDGDNVANDKSAKLAALKPALDDRSAIIAAADKRSTPLAEASSKHNALAEAVSNTLPPAMPREAPMTATTPLSVSTPVQSNAWAADIADKIVWMAGNDKQSAKLTLNPAHLGPLEISLNIDKGHATASFVSASAEVRDALENALPRLREMFANAGISLGQTNVGAESFSQQANANLQNGTQSGAAARWQADGAILAGDFSGAMPVSSFIAQRGNGMVDTFA